MLTNFFGKVFLKIRIELRFIRKRYSRNIIENEKINKNYIKNFLPQRPVIIDAGAHIGSDSIEMSRLYRKSQIHAFEPVPSVFKNLENNIRKYKNIIGYKIALSDKSGEQELYISSGASDASSSLLKPQAHLEDHPNVLFIEKTIVKTITLDDWAQQNHIDKVDFLWLDLQGFELEILKASKLIFPTVNIVHMEISTKPTYEGVTLYPDTKLWMEQNGFYVDKEAIPKGWDMGNVLFIRNK